MPRVIAMPLILLLTALPAAAQSNAPETENGRYSLTPIDDGFLRLDTRTGRVSVCSRRAMGWSCHPVPDERAALEDEIARLQRDNATLKKDMLARGITPPGAPTAPAPVPGPAEKPTLKVPSDAELDRAMAVMERMWKRLVEMVQRWQREMTPI
ncbi:MAG: hypothetical protein ACO1NY_04810 [Pseudorhodoplanes sp.]